MPGTAVTSSGADGAYARRRSAARAATATAEAPLSTAACGPVLAAWSPRAAAVPAPGGASPTRTADDSAPAASTWHGAQTATNIPLSAGGARRRRTMQSALLPAAAVAPADDRWSCGAGTLRAKSCGDGKEALPFPGAGAASEPGGPEGDAWLARPERASCRASCHSEKPVSSAAGEAAASCHSGGEAGVVAANC